MKYGIEKLKFLVLTSKKISKKLVKAMEDGKISLLESISFLPMLADIRQLVINAPDLYKEYEDLSDSERIELVLFFEKNFEIDNVTAKHYVQTIFDAILKLSDVFKLFSNSK